MGRTGVWPGDLGLLLLLSRGMGEMWPELTWSPAPCSCGRVAVTHPASRRAPGPTWDQHSPGLILCSPCPGRRGSRARPLGSGRGGSCWQRCPPPPSSAEGSARVGFGCPGPACPRGPASWFADQLWGRAGSPGTAGEGFPFPAGAEGRMPAGPPASLAFSRRGCPTASPAASSLRASSSPGVRWADAGPHHPLWV